MIASTSGSGLASGLDGFRLTLHVLAATIWVGGQFTVAGLLPTLRSLGADAPKKVARAFARLLWPAYGVLVVTGLWNVAVDKPSTQSSAWNTVLAVKVAVVALAGVAAFLHQRSTSKAGLAAFGAVAALSSVAALALGVFLTN